jgi:hypothetical protein
MKCRTCKKGVQAIGELSGNCADCDRDAWVKALGGSWECPRCLVTVTRGSCLRTGLCDCGEPRPGMRPTPLVGAPGIEGIPVIISKYAARCYLVPAALLRGVSREPGETGAEALERHLKERPTDVVVAPSLVDLRKELGVEL